jgi:hypothetical protein
VHDALPFWSSRFTVGSSTNTSAGSLAKALAHSLLFSGAKLGMSVIAAIGQSDEIEKLARAGRGSFGPRRSSGAARPPRRSALGVKEGEPNAFKSVRGLVRETEIFRSASPSRSSRHRSRLTPVCSRT